MKGEGEGTVGSWGGDAAHGRQGGRKETVVTEREGLFLLVCGVWGEAEDGHLFGAVA